MRLYGCWRCAVGSVLDRVVRSGVGLCGLAWCCLLLATPAIAGEAPVARMVACHVSVAHGSGVLISADGLVLTNHHVIEGETALEARWADGSTAPCRVIGRDPVGDLALLRAESLPAGRVWAELAPLSAIVPGATVFAVGNPFALGDLDDLPTLTRGVLSTGRVARGDYADTLIGDAAVNPGNSGGALYDDAGRLLGINGQIRMLTGFRVNSGIGLAISAPQIAAFLPGLLAAEGGYVFHATLPEGCEVADSDAGPRIVKAGSGGLPTGASILAVDGRPTPTANAVRGACMALPWREGLAVPVLLREADRAEPRTHSLGLAKRSVPGRPWLGWTTAARGEGAVIQVVETGSAAALAGLKAGDQVLAVDGQPIATRIAFLRASSRLACGDRPRLRIRRGGAEQDLPALLVLRRPGTGME
jgi:S1-C subfamily serine protease